jgi:hypothetical protein
VFTVASKFAALFQRRTVLLVVSVAIAVVLGKVGHFGMWDGPAGG